MRNTLLLLIVVSVFGCGRVSTRNGGEGPDTGEIRIQGLRTAGAPISLATVSNNPDCVVSNLGDHYCQPPGSPIHVPCNLDKAGSTYCDKPAAPGDGTIDGGISRCFQNATGFACVPEQKCSQIYPSRCNPGGFTNL